MLTLAEFNRACPQGKVPYVRSVEVLDDFEPGDVVLGHRPDNGRRGALRTRAAVIVGRYIDATPKGAA